MDSESMLAAPLTCVVTVPMSAGALAELVRQVVAEVPEARVVAATPDPRPVPHDPRLTLVDGGDLDDLLARVTAPARHVVLVLAPLRFEPGALTGLAEQLESDLGVGSVSALSAELVEALERSLDESAPARGPVAAPRLDRVRRATIEPFSVPWPVGTAVALSRGALSRVPSLPPAPTAPERLRVWASATGSRAFCHLVDPSRIVTPDRPAGDGGVEVFDDLRTADAARRIRVAARGLRVHIDGRTLEGNETGTEVHTLNLIRALSDRPEIVYLGVNLRDDVPVYGRSVLERPGVTAYAGCGEWQSDLPRVDVVHRPYQPLSAQDCARWREFGARIACTIQDLITFLTPEYHESVKEWRAARRRSQEALASVDGVFCLSDYVRAQVLREGLRRDPDLVWTYHCGVDHITEPGLLEPPPELADVLDRPFGLVLGSTYGHKNHDLAVAALVEVGGDSGLLAVSAGRQLDDGPAGTVGDVRTIARNVSTAERNWLLANARIVVNATSAEGFGMVPFEAAAFGTPTVSVPVGAVAEALGDQPVWAADWSLPELVAAIRQVVTDRRMRSLQVDATRRAGAELTWDRTAGIVLRGYEALLARPARS